MELRIEKEVLTDGSDSYKFILDDGYGRIIIDTDAVSISDCLTKSTHLIDTMVSITGSKLRVIYTDSLLS